MILPRKIEAHFFYLVGDAGKQPLSPKSVREFFPRIGIIPTLMPIDQTEQVLQEEYVRRSIDGRLASRHFRNQLNLLKINGDDYFNSYCSMVEHWTPEIQIKDLSKRVGAKAQEIDLFYREIQGRTDMEIYWSGDGLQIWLQFLLHLHRLKGSSIIILDEPDVYLHADLQRRLVRVLKECEAQTITATHSLEILGEAGSGAITLVDRTRRKTFRAPGDEMLAGVSEIIGSQFNIRLARALRAKAVVFVEGKDLGLLRNMANKVGATSLVTEYQVAVIPLDGFSNWENMIPFQWLTNVLLNKSVPVFAVLDRDYRLEEELGDITNKLNEYGVIPLIWKRKELESYLLNIECIQRLTGAPEAWLRKTMSGIINSLEDFCLARVHKQYAQLGRKNREQEVTVTAEALAAFRLEWNNSSSRVNIVPPKEVLTRLNEKLTGEGYKPTSFKAISYEIRNTEIPDEVRTNLQKIDQVINRPIFKQLK